MQFYTVSVMLAGDRNQIVSNKGPISVAEIAILREIHGAESVFDFRPAPKPEGYDRGEHLEQLKVRYSNATPGEVNRVVERLFGPLGKMPTTLQSIGVNPAAEAAKLRKQAEEAAAAAAKFEDEVAEVAGEDEEDDFAEFVDAKETEDA